MIRPWYRSRLFWLGIPGLVFLLWSWFAYPRRGMDLIWAGTDRWMCLRDNGRHIFIAYQALPPPGKPGFVIRQDTCGPEQVDPLLPPAIKWRTGLQGFNLVVAYTAIFTPKTHKLTHHRKMSARYIWEYVECNRTARCDTHTQGGWVSATAAVEIFGDSRL